MTAKIEKALSLGKVVGAKKLLEEFYLEEDKSQWLATKQEEYDVLYKTVEVQVEEELDEDGNVVVEASTYFEYVEDCPTVNEWISETRVVTEAIEATYDADGMELTPAVAEVTEMVRPYVASDVSELVETYLANNTKYQSDLRQDAMMKGETYTLSGVDYSVPFTKDDADGLIQVNAAFQLGVTETVIYFTNGTKIPITTTEFNDFVVWFVNKRNSFFI